MKPKLNHLIRPLFILTLFISACGSADTDSVPIGKKEVKTVAKKEAKTILFFGNSLTAGFGLSLEESFPLLIQKKVNSLSLSYKCVNAGVSGETTTTGLNRLPWVLKQKVDVFVLELGANDGLRGIPVATSKKNLIAMILKVKETYPKAKVVLCGMQVPPNMGETYANNFKVIYPEIAAAHPTIRLIPFLLDGVAGDPILNQADGIHPTEEGARIVSETIWTYLKEVL
jgi:acyl-CoA thioesterase I